MYVNSRKCIVNSVSKYYCKQCFVLYCTVKYCKICYEKNIGKKVKIIGVEKIKLSPLLVQKKKS